MNNFRSICFFCLLFLLFRPVFSQDIKQFGFMLPPKVKRVTIPFEMHNNLVVIPITINRFVTLKFILDTGVETAILTEKLFADLMGLEYARTIRVDGPGLIDSVEAFVSTGNHFGILDKVLGHNMNLLVLKEDYLNLPETIGDDVHGIIGYDIFRRFIVAIDYDKRVLTLSKFNQRRSYKKYERLPIDLVKTKPFLKAGLGNDELSFINLMIDTGASHALLLDYNEIEGIDHPQEVIHSSLGRGIGGDIPGVIGRLDKFTIKGFQFSDVLISIPEEGAYNGSIKRGAREGTLGGDVLRRFDVAFDYYKKRIYMKKSSYFSDAFEFDMSGIDLITVGQDLDTLRAIKVYEDSPAYEAGIRTHDIILTINGKSIENNQLSDFQSLLRKRENLQIRVKYSREGDVRKTQFLLKRKI